MCLQHPVQPHRLCWLSTNTCPHRHAFMSYHNWLGHIGYLCNFCAGTEWDVYSLSCRRDHVHTGCGCPEEQSMNWPGGRHPSRVWYPRAWQLTQPCSTLVHWKICCQSCFTSRSVQSSCMQSGMHMCWFGRFQNLFVAAWDYKLVHKRAPGTPTNQYQKGL